VGALAIAEELKNADVYITKGKKASAPLTYTGDASKLALCDHMLVLLDERTWTSGEDTAQFVEHIHDAMRIGVHLNCVHEFPAVVGPTRHECEFGLMFGDDWTPAHLTGGKTNLYKEIALALKGVEWRQPGLVAFASKVAASAGEHKPIVFTVPDTYRPKRGPNKWKNSATAMQVETLLRQFDADRDYIVSENELHTLLARAKLGLPTSESSRIYRELIAGGWDLNGDGSLSVEEVAAYWVAEYGHNHSDLTEVSAVATKLDDAKAELPAPPTTASATGERGPCGMINVPGATFCAGCGSPLAGPVAPVAPVVVPMQPVVPTQPAAPMDLSDRIMSLFSPHATPTAADSEKTVATTLPPALAAKPDVESSTSRDVVQMGAGNDKERSASLTA